MKEKNMSSSPLSAPLVPLSKPDWQYWDEITKAIDTTELDRQSGVFRGDTSNYAYPFVIKMIAAHRPIPESTAGQRKAYLSVAGKVKQMAQDNPPSKESLPKRIVNVFTCCLCGTDPAYKERRIIADASLNPEDFSERIDDYDPSC